MKLTELNKDNCRIIGGAIENALKSIEKQFGVSIRRKSWSFTVNHLTLKLECSIVKNGKAISKEAEDFKHYACLYELAADDLGKTFNFQGQSWVITGLKSKSHKYPILASKGDGHTFKFPANIVKANIVK